MLKTFSFYEIDGDRLPIYLGAILLSTIGDAGRKVANSYLIKDIVAAAQTGNADNIFILVLGNFAVFVFWFVFVAFWYYTL